MRTTSTTRRLVVNADDFGRSPGINRGIIRCHEHGVVTSASLMVRWPAAAEAAAYARGRARLGLGLHLDLGEWAFRDGAWVALYEVVPAGDATEVEREARRQLDRFRELTGGANPTHVDSHQHVHRHPPARDAALRLARELEVPLRHFSPVRYFGGFYGQSDEGEPFPDGVGVEALVRLLAALPTGDQECAELCCHPAAEVEADVETMYRDERAAEARTLCDPRVRRAVEEAGFELCTFRRWAGCELAGGGDDTRRADA